MKINQAIVLRITELLSAKNMTKYRLAEESGVSHSQLAFILKERNNSVDFKTVLKLAKGFGMTLQEFLACKYFEINKLDLD